jgi:hypothetical protein
VFVGASALCSNRRRQSQPGQGNHEGCAPACGIFDEDAPAERFDHQTAEGQAKTGSARRLLPAKAHERLEDAVALLGRNGRAAVDDLKAQTALLLWRMVSSNGATARLSF